MLWPCYTGINMRSKDSYDNQIGAEKFIQFLNTDSGQTHQDVLYTAFRNALGNDKNQKILDAACGPGWLSAKLKPEFPNIESCDGSKFFLDHLKRSYPDIKAQQVDLSETLPYSDAEFDTIIFSMAAHDVEDQQKTFSELGRTLKYGGKLLISIANPYFAYPAGVWKRSILDWVLSRKPSLTVSPYHWFTKQSRNYTFHGVLESYFYKLSEHINNATTSGFNLRRLEELECKEDSPKFNLQYKLHRYPSLLFMEFEKSRQ